MADQDGLLASITEDLDSYVGQLCMVTFEGTSINDTIRSLIEVQRVGSVLLTASNLTSAEQVTKLVLDLQTVAYNAAHPAPLVIAISPEDSRLLSFRDEIHLHIFPCADGLAATGDRQLIHDIARASAEELKALGVNLILGLSLDASPTGVNSNKAQESSMYSVQTLNGYKAVGVSCAGEQDKTLFTGSVPNAFNDAYDQKQDHQSFKQEVLTPLRLAVAQGIDALLLTDVDGAANTVNGSLRRSAQAGAEFLRRDVSFGGVTMVEPRNIGMLMIKTTAEGATISAMESGCDIVTLSCSTLDQLAAVHCLAFGIHNGAFSQSRVARSAHRVLQMKQRSTTWQQALRPAGLTRLMQLQPEHTALSCMAYHGSITVVRDDLQCIPLNKAVESSEEVLLLTPLLKPWPKPATPGKSSTDAAIKEAESLFRGLGQSLAQSRRGKVSHASYTQTGFRPLHENLIGRSSAVIVVTADTDLNLYQHAFARHVSMTCKSLHKSERQREKPHVVIAVSSPNDFVLDGFISTYVCTYDFTAPALEALTKVLMGEIAPTGTLPSTQPLFSDSHDSSGYWLAEAFDEERDSLHLDALLQVAKEREPSNPAVLAGTTSGSFLLRNPDIHEVHFVIRNEMTNELHGFCATYVYKMSGIGAIGAVVVEPSRRHASVGRALQKRAIHSLQQQTAVTSMQLGCRLPSVYLGLPGPSHQPLPHSNLPKYTSLNSSSSTTVYRMTIPDLSQWRPPEGLGHTLSNPEVKYDMVSGADYLPSLQALLLQNPKAGVPESYNIALADKANCGVIRAKQASDGTVIGCLIVYKGASRLASWTPTIAEKRYVTGGLSGLTTTDDAESVMQGLVLLGIRQVKRQGFSAVILDAVEGEGTANGLCLMGFTIMHSFEEIVIDANMP